MKKEQCGNCRFWNLISKRGHAKANFDGEELTLHFAVGACRRFPPLFSRPPGRDRVYSVDASLVFETHFPLTSEFNNCGEFQPAPTAPKRVQKKRKLKPRS